MVKQKKREGEGGKTKKEEGRMVKQKRGAEGGKTKKGGGEGGKTKKEVMLRPPVVHVPRHFPCIRFPPHSLSPVMSISPFIHV